MAVVVTTADTTMKSAKVEHALHMMRAYLEDCAKEKEEASNRRMEELNGVIRACVERLVVDRRDYDRIRDRRLPLDALGHAIRYVDEHLDAKLKWNDMGSQLRMDALASGRRLKASIGMTRYIIRSRLRGAMKLLRDDTMSLAGIALQVGCSCQRRLTCFFRARASFFAPLVRAGRIAVDVVTCLLGACATDHASEPLFTQAGSVLALAGSASAYNRIEGEQCQRPSEQAHETLADARFPVPLYVIAAAALLG